MPEPEAPAPLTAALQPFIDRHQLAGAVTLVADRDRTLDLGTVGFADLDARTPMQPDALFWIASQTKPITGTILMMLVEEGRVALDDPVAKYLPEFEGQWCVAEEDADHLLLRKPERPVTLRHLLSHTSGLPFASVMETPTFDRLRLDDAVRSYAMTPLRSEPGARYQYSNAGINTAARILEIVSGMTYEAFLVERLLQPLGMADTTFRPDRRQLSRLAKSYKPDADGTGLEETRITQLSYPLDDPARQPLPAGGLFSTASDLERFCRMILNGGVFEGRRYLSPDSVREMTRKQTGDLPESYGLGWSVDVGGFGHGGAYATNIRIEPERGLILVFLVQLSEDSAGVGGQGFGAFAEAARERFQKRR